MMLPLVSGGKLLMSLLAANIYTFSKYSFGCQPDKCRCCRSEPSHVSCFTSVHTKLHLSKHILLSFLPQDSERWWMLQSPCSSSPVLMQSLFLTPSSFPETRRPSSDNSCYRGADDYDRVSTKCFSFKACFCGACCEFPHKNKMEA